MILTRIAGAFLLSAVAAATATRMVGAHPQAAAGPRSEIAFSTAARAEPVTGMVYVAISRESDARRTPIQQVDTNGVPFFSTAVEALAPGATAAITATNLGHPVASL